jgi:hypothetical protein
VSKQYLTPKEQKSWLPNWSAFVYKTGPQVTSPAYPATAKNPTTATVAVTGDIQASLKGSGSYSLPSASSQGDVSDGPAPFQLQKVGGQWRISYAPPELLLTNDSFENDYQLRKLYFFDPISRYLVPDPVYVPLGARPVDLMNGLVRDLITPPSDWLWGATKTAFPAGTKISDVTLNGVTAIVNLTGTITRASTSTMRQVSAQLLSTLLSDAAQGGPNGQAVQSVEVELAGKPWSPLGPQGNPIQLASKYYTPAAGASTKFYYVDSSGYLDSRPSAGGPPDRLAKIGTGYSQIAVSPDGDYVAALHGETLYAGLIGSRLVKREGGGYLAMSWDVNDDLWASAGTQIVMFRGSGARQPLGEMVPVNVVTTASPTYTALKVAPDGVRVAIVEGGGFLIFGAISGQQGPDPQISLSTVQDTPQFTPVQNSLDATFTALAWYGPDNVITLATPGPTAIEYPVSGGTPTSIPTDSGMQAIAASSGQPLIAGLPNGQMVADASTTTGSWTTINDGDTSAKGKTPPVYPG